MALFGRGIVAELEICESKVRVYQLLFHERYVLYNFFYLEIKEEKKRKEKKMQYLFRIIKITIQNLW